MTPKDVTQADVVAAEREAAADRDKIATLEKRVMNGEEVTPLDLATAKQLAEWSDLRVIAVRQQAEHTARQKLADKRANLYQRMTSYDPQDAISPKMRALVDLIAEVIADGDGHNRQLGEWLHEMRNLGIPEHNSPIMPSAEYARLGHIHGDLIAGKRVMRRVDVGWLLARALEMARASSATPYIALDLRGGKVDLAHPEPGIDPYERISALVEDRPEPTASHFYVGGGGAVIATDHEYSPADIKRLSLRTITREEAWPE